MLKRESKMSPKLIKYLQDHLWDWNKWNDGWTKYTNAECYSEISMKDGGYIYGEDCPDIWNKLEDFPPEYFFEDEEKLIEFLERLKLTKPT